MFNWWVAVKGYQWVAEDGTTVLPSKTMSKDEDDNWPDCHLEPVKESFRAYDPFEFTALFRNFADTPPTPAGMLAFANEFGHLGDEVLDLSDRLDLLETPAFESEAEEVGWREHVERHIRLFDSISHWDDAIRTMSRCVKLWDECRQGLAGVEAIGEVFDTVNRRLTGDRIRVAFEKRDRTPGGWAMHTYPTNLLAALWLQLGRAVIEDKQFASCRTCGRWFEVAPPVTRKSRNFCRESCRSRAYRSRIAEAHRMRQAGKSIREIADALESSVPTVEGWLKKTQE